MKRLSFIVLFLLVLPILSAPAEEFWTPLNGPDLGQVFEMAEDSSGNIWATARTALFRSKDKGRSWERVQHSIDQPLRIVVTPKGTIVLGNSPGSKLLRSEDGGETWGVDQKLITYIVVNSKGTLFIADRHSIYRSIDEGKTWEYLPNCPSELDISHIGELYHSPGNTLYVTQGDRHVYRSPDGGETWEVLPPLLGVGITELTVYSNGALIAATLSGLFLYDEISQEWVRFALAGKKVNAVEIQGNTILAGLENGPIARSRDGGKTWDTVGTEGMRIGITHITLLSNGSILVVTYADVYRSDDGGEHWERSNKGMISNDVTAMAFAPDGTIYAACWQAGIYRSDDRGQTWRHVLPLKTYTATLLVTTDGTLYTGNKPGVYVSKDKGETWELYSTGFEGSDPNVKHLLLSPSGVLYAGANGVYASYDSARSWKRISDRGSVRGLALAADGRLVAGFDMDGMYGTYNEGKTWGILYTVRAPDVFQMLSMTTSPDGVVYAGVIRPHLVVQVMNNNNYCKRYEFPAEGDIAEHMICDWERTMYVASHDRLYRVSTTDWKWEETHGGLDNRKISSFALDSNRVLYAGTAGSGIYRTTVSTSVREELKDAVGVNVYPNPVDVGTSVTVVLPASIKGRRVQYTLTNMLGQKIVAATIHQDDHTLNIPTANLAAGLYYMYINDGISFKTGSFTVLP